MTLFNKSKIIVLSIIIFLTLLLISIFIFLNIKTRYNKYVITENKWNSLINNRALNSNLIFDSIEFNDYELVYDSSDKTIYYSVVDSSKKYNPLVSFKSNNSNLKIAFKEKITSDNEIVEVLVYDKDSYNICTLFVTDLSIINVIKNNETSDNVTIDVFDNHITAKNRVTKSSAKFLTIKEDEEYILSLIKMSLGRNNRENEISLFGMDKSHDYILKHDSRNKEKLTLLFINNEYKGVYSIEGREGRRKNG